MPLKYRFVVNMMRSTCGGEVAEVLVSVCMVDLLPRSSTGLTPSTRLGINPVYPVPITCWCEINRILLKSLSQLLVKLTSVDCPKVLCRIAICKPWQYVVSLKVISVMVGRKSTMACSSHQY